jgi:CheY-like chemotaxis protein
MARIFLLHWKNEELAERAARLRRAGYRVKAIASLEGDAIRAFRDEPPAAVVIDLSRLPSHGRAVAMALRQQKRTRHVPLVFVEGVPDKIARMRRELPDAVYTTWSKIAPAVRRAIDEKPEMPVVPRSTSGYSGTPLPKKLGVVGDRTVILLHAPKGFEALIRAKDGTPRIRRGDRGQADVVIWFVKKSAELKSRIGAAKRAITDGGAIWIAWPKKSSGVATDLSESVVRTTGLKAGLVDYKICAIDDTWSGLKFARRKKKPD